MWAIWRIIIRTPVRLRSAWCFVTFGGKMEAKFFSFVQTVPVPNILPVKSLEFASLLPRGSSPIAEWELLSLLPDQREIKYAIGSQVDCYIHMLMKRRPLFYLVNIVVPSFIITSLSIVGLFTPFSSTGEREEKVGARIQINYFDLMRLTASFGGSR